MKRLVYIVFALVGALMVVGSCNRLPRLAATPSRGGRYAYYRTYDSWPFGPSTGSGAFLTGCGCWYWPRSGVHRRFWVGDGRPTAAGEAFHYDWLPGGEVASDLTTDCSGASRRHWRHGSVVCPSERKGVVRPRTPGKS